MSKHSADFGTILDRCIAAIETRDRTVEDCLTEYAAQRDQLEPLLRTVESLQRIRGAVQPSETFRQQAPARLQARLRQSQRLPSRRGATRRATPGYAKRVSLGPWIRRLAPVMAVLIVALGLVTGVAYAADDAAPGDTLYWVDQTVEQLQLNLATPERSFSLRLEFADERLLEAEQLAEKGDTEHLAEALAQYEKLASDLTQEVKAGEGIENEELLAQLDSELSTHEERLKSLLDKVPEPAKKGITQAIQASQKNREHTQEAIQGQQGGGKPEDTPGGKPEDTSGGKPEDTPGVGPKDKSEEESEGDTGDQDKGKSDKNPDDKSGGKSDDKSGGKPDDTPGGKPEGTPVGKPDNPSGGKPDNSNGNSDNPNKKDK
jgi:hypothetical protein